MMAVGPQPDLISTDLGHGDGVQDIVSPTCGVVRCEPGRPVHKPAVMLMRSLPVISDLIERNRSR